MSEFFKFEDTTRDFPYYRHNPRISKKAWIVLLMSIPISIIAYVLVAVESEIVGSLVFALVLLIPLLYYSNWDLSLIIRKPTRKEIRLAILLFIGYIIYALVIGGVIDGFTQAAETGGDYFGVSWEMLFALIFSIFAEELIKFIPLMLLMRIIYKYTNNRKAAIIISTFAILIFFGLLHYDPPEFPLISVLAIQGFGSIFELYGYVKTKNIFVPYLSHLLTDASIFLLMLIGL